MIPPSISEKGRLGRDSNGLHRDEEDHRAGSEYAGRGPLEGVRSFVQSDLGSDSRPGEARHQKRRHT